MNFNPWIKLCLSPVFETLEKSTSNIEPKFSGWDLIYKLL